MLLIVLLTTVVAIAVLLEILRVVAIGVLPRFHREDTLRDAVRQIQADLAVAKKRADTLSDAARAVRQEIARAEEAQAELEREFAKRKKVEPVLVFTVGVPDESGDGYIRRFRAVITKTLPGEPDPTQTQIWSRLCFVEAQGHSAIEAKLEAHLQFPSAQGYVIGPFAEHGAATSPAATENEVA